MIDNVFVILYFLLSESASQARVHALIIFVIFPQGESETIIDGKRGNRRVWRIQKSPLSREPQFIYLSGHQPSPFVERFSA